MEPTLLAGYSRKLDLEDQLIAVQLIDLAVAALHQCGNKIGGTTHLSLGRAGGRTGTSYRFQHSAFVVQGD